MEIRRVDTFKWTPIGGWKTNTWYLIDVSFGKTNPIHRAVLYTGFVREDGEPGGYNIVVNPSYDQMFKYSELYYVKPVRLIVEEDEFCNASYDLPKEHKYEAEASDIDSDLLDDIGAGGSY